MRASAWTVPHDHPAFAGHFPGRPMVPGVVLLDRAIHQAGVDLGRSMAGVRVTAAKFFSPVGPGETVTFVWQDKATLLQCELRCTDRPVAVLTLQLPAAPGT